MKCEHEVTVTSQDYTNRVDSSVICFFLLPLPPFKAPAEPTHTGLDLCYAGRIEIAGEASLEDLKMQVRCSPVLDCAAAL